MPELTTYTAGQVHLGRQFGLFLTAIFLLSVAGMLRSACPPGGPETHAPLPREQGQVFKIHVPKCGQTAQVSYSADGAPVHAADLPAGDSEAIWRSARVTTAGEWEIAVAVDRIHCDIYCAYRRRQDAPTRLSPVALLLPPITAIQVSLDGVTKPLSFSIDPAGLAYPCATCDFAGAPEQLYLPAKRFRMGISQGTSARTAPVDIRPCPAAETPNFSVPTLAPLRI